MLQLTANYLHFLQPLRFVAKGPSKTDSNIRQLSLTVSEERMSQGFFFFWFIFTQGQTEGQLETKEKKYVNMLLLWAES